MRKGKIIRLITAVSLSISLLAAGGIYASAQTPDKEITAIPREFKDVALATVDKGTDYDLSSLDLKTLPAYMEESLGFSELSAEKQPISVTDLNVEDLYSFTTYNEDDTLTLYMFSEPVKFVDKETSAIRFIDNTIKVSAENSPPVLSGQLNAVGNELYTAKSYTNTANFFKVDMPSSVNQGISLSYDNKKFILSPATASLSTATLKTAAHRGMREQVVEYRNALGDGIHLQYVPINNGVKENIILDRYPGRNTFNFIFDAGGYYPVYTEGESIPFADPTTDEIALILGQADARDSYTGDETDGHFTLYNSLKVESLGNGKYTLTVTIDEDFLTDPDTVYPVVIDPSVSISCNYMQDTTVYSAKQTQNYYSSSYNIVGNHGSSYGEGTAFIKATNMSNYSYINPNYIITAYYRVYEGSGKTNTMYVQVREPSATWSQTTLTNANKPSLSSAITTLTITRSGWHTFDITKSVKNWINYLLGNGSRSQEYGFALTASEANVSSKHFCSANYTGSTTPSFIINYSNSSRMLNYEYPQPFMAWGSLLNGNSPIVTFYVHQTGTYVFETLGSSYFTSDDNPTTNTRMALHDIDYNRIAYNNDVSSSNKYSRITANLSQGLYRLAVTDQDGKVDNVKCYVIIEGFLSDSPSYGELAGDATYYYNLKEFYKIGDADEKTCLAYVLDSEDSGLEATSYSNAINIMNEYGYKEVQMSSPELDINNCIVSYGTSDEINHYAKIENGVVTAKLNGDEEYVMHPNYDCYTSPQHAVIRFFTYDP